MIHHNRGRWHFHSHIATFTRRGEQVQKYISDPERWQEMVEKHEHLSDLTVEEIQYTEEQQDRLEEVNEIRVPAGHQSAVKEYVENGIFPERKTHPLSPLQNEKRVNALEKGAGIGQKSERGISARLDDIEDRLAAMDDK